MVVNAKNRRATAIKPLPNAGNCVSIAAWVKSDPMVSPFTFSTIKPPSGLMTLYCPVNKIMSAVAVQTNKVSTYTEKA